MNPRVKRLIDIEKMKQEHDLGIGFYNFRTARSAVRTILLKRYFQYIKWIFEPSEENKVKFFGEQPNPQFTTPEMDPLLSKFSFEYFWQTDFLRRKYCWQIYFGHKIIWKILFIENWSLGGVMKHDSFCSWVQVKWWIRKTQIV